MFRNKSNYITKLAWTYINLTMFIEKYANI